MLVEQYDLTREQTKALCLPLFTEDYIPQPVEFASPPKWHIAHVTWFFEEMILKKYLDGYVEFDPQFCFLFNSYYAGVGERTKRFERGAITRPTVSRVYEYRDYVDASMRMLLASNPDQDIIDLVMLGIAHEEQHQELLLMDLKHTFSLNPTSPVYSSSRDLMEEKDADHGWVDINQGQYEIGFVGQGFHFDNELGRHTQHLAKSQISKALVTNGEYLEYMKNGGYDDFNFWLDEGWAWRQENNVACPLYWRQIDGEWWHYTLSGMRRIDLDAQLAHISFYEASAYANWIGCRLPTEFEWEVASTEFSWGNRWEWTSSAYQAYPGFEISEGAVGEYNGKFMINQMVLRGASVVTAASHSRASYRNFFHPHMQWQYSGIRLAR